jgi:hypothetical protein
MYSTPAGTLSPVGLNRALHPFVARSTSKALNEATDASSQRSKTMKLLSDVM